MSGTHAHKGLKGSLEPKSQAGCRRIRPVYSELEELGRSKATDAEMFTSSLRGKTLDAPPKAVIFYIFDLSVADGEYQKHANQRKLRRERTLGSTARISHAHQTTQVLRMVYKKVFVAGGARGVGRALIDKLVAQGSEVVALVRREDAKEELDAIDGVTAEVCDALDLKGVESVLDGCDAAISTLGGIPDGDEEKRVDYTGNRNVIESAGILGITRLVLVSSVGCGSSREAISDAVYQVLENALKAKTKAENMLLKYYTNSEWTIIRPGGLKNDAATRTAILTEDSKVAGVINRADVADLVVQALNSPRTVRKILTAIDPSEDGQRDAGRPEPFEL